MTDLHSLRQWITRGVILVIFTAIFTLLCVRESKLNGRLSSAPNFDDCTYFLEGAILLNDIKLVGPGGFSKYLNEPGPNGFHSPYSIFLAAASYAIFGPCETSPYYGNAVVVFFYLAGLGWILRTLSTPAWMLAIGLFLTPPFITMGVVEFRPDIAWAVITGFSVVWIITSNRIFSCARYAALAGVFAALALLITPSTFVMTTLLFTGAILSRIPGYFLMPRREESIGSAVRGTAVFLTTLLLIAGPYWWRFGRDIWLYFWSNSFGTNKQLWISECSLKDSLLYYITGPATASNVAFSGQIITVLAVACSVVLLMKRQDLRWKIFVLFACLTGAVVVNTVAQMKTQFLGGGIYGVWLFGSAFLMAETWKLLREPKNCGLLIRIAPTLLIGICCVIALIGYRWPEYSSWRKDSPLCENNRYANDQMKALLDQYSVHPPANILFSQAGPVVMETTSLWYPFHNFKAQNGSACLFRTEQEFQKNYPSFEWVVVQESGTMGFSPNMPSEALLPQFIRMLSRDQNYHIIKEFRSLNDRKIWIYARAGNAQKK